MRQRALRRWRSLGVVLVLLALLAAGAPPAGAEGDADAEGDEGGDAPPTNETGGNEGNATAVTGYVFPVAIVGYAFSPQAVTVQQGDVVRFSNGADHAHGVVIDALDADSGTIPPDADWELEATQVGNFTFRCPYHAGMAGTLAVKAPDAENRAPSVFIESPGDDSRLSGRVNVTGRVEDPDGDAVVVRVRVDSGRWARADVAAGGAWSIGWDTTQVENGAHTLQVIAQDAHGAHSTVDVIGVTVRNTKEVEDRAYTAVITHPRDGAFVTGPVRVEGLTDLPSDPERLPPDAEVRARIGGGRWEVANGTRTWNVTLDSLAVRDGTRVIEVVVHANGRDGPVARVGVQVGNDVANPMHVEITSPSERSRVSGITDIRGYASDARDRDLTIMVRVDDGPWQAAAGTNPWSAAWDTTLYEDGPHVIEAKAVAGEQVSRVARTTVFSVNAEDVQRPVVVIDAPDGRSPVNGTVLVSGSASSPSGHPVTVEVRVGDGPWETASGSRTWAFTVDTTTLPNGVHPVHVRAFHEQASSEEAKVNLLVANPVEKTPEPPAGSTDDTPPTRRDAARQGVEDEVETPAPGVALALAAAAAVAALTGTRRARRS